MVGSPNSWHLVLLRSASDTTMIAWVSSFAFLAVALAAPQLQTLPLRSQIITNQPATRIISSQPYVSNVQAIPSYGNLQTLGLSNVQSLGVQSLPAYSNLQSLPINVQQGLPINTVNYQQLPVQTIRYNQIPTGQTILPTSQTLLPTTQTLRPAVTQIRTSQPTIIRTSAVQPILQSQPIVQAQPIIQRTVAPLAVQQRIVPQQLQGVAILRQVQDVQADGSYAYAFETENGIRSQEEGRVLNQGTDQEANVVQGSYSYTAPDGTPITVNYVADENGFRAEGEHIPKPSEAILRSLEYLRSLPPRPEDESGKYVPDRNRY